VSTATHPLVNGQPNPGIKYQQISSGDGFATMADGTQTYLFAFGPLSGLADHYQGRPGTEATSVFNQESPTGDGTPSTLEGMPDAGVTFNGAIGKVMRADLFELHTVHFHGHSNASAFHDGVPMPRWPSTSAAASPTAISPPTPPPTSGHERHALLVSPVVAWGNDEGMLRDAAADGARPQRRPRPGSRCRSATGRWATGCANSTTEPVAPIRLPAGDCGAPSSPCRRRLRPAGRPRGNHRIPITA